MRNPSTSKTAKKTQPEDLIDVLSDLANLPERLRACRRGYEGSGGPEEYSSRLVAANDVLRILAATINYECPLGERAKRGTDSLVKQLQRVSWELSNLVGQLPQLVSFLHNRGARYPRRPLLGFGDFDPRVVEPLIHPNVGSVLRVAVVDALPPGDPRRVEAERVGLERFNLGSDLYAPSRDLDEAIGMSIWLRDSLAEEQPKRKRKRRLPRPRRRVIPVGDRSQKPSATGTALGSDESPMQPEAPSRNS